MDVFADYVTSSCLKNLCAERGLTKIGNHGELASRLLWWKKPVNNELEGWTSTALTVKFKADQLAAMCRERYLPHNGTKEKIVSTLMSWKKGPFQNLLNWTEEQLVKRCTQQELRRLCKDYDLEVSKHVSSVVLATRLIEYRDYSEPEESSEEDDDSEENSMNDEKVLLSVRKTDKKNFKNNKNKSNNNMNNNNNKNNKKTPLLLLMSARAKKSPVWQQVWTFLKSEGWTWCNGGALVSFFYMKPGVSKRTGVLGSTMFSSEEDVIASLSDTIMKMAMESPISREKTRAQAERTERLKMPVIWKWLLKEKGWIYTKGKGLVSWFYVRPNVEPSDYKHLVNMYHGLDEVVKSLSAEVGGCGV